MASATHIALAEAEQKIERLTTAMKEACDLLMEITHGNPARSAGHNARLCLESALKPTASA